RIPFARLAIIARAAAALLVKIAEVGHGERKTALGGLQKPAPCLAVIARNPVAVRVQLAEPHHRRGVADRCRPAEPRPRLGIVTSHTPTGRELETEIMHRLRVAEVGSASIPAMGFFVALCLLVTTAKL